jgi:hypothetical protein
VVVGRTVVLIVAVDALFALTVLSLISEIFETDTLEEIKVPDFTEASSDASPEDSFPVVVVVAVATGTTIGIACDEVSVTVGMTTVCVWEAADSIKELLSDFAECVLLEDSVEPVSPRLFPALLSVCPAVDN